MRLRLALLAGLAWLLVESGRALAAPLSTLAPILVAAAGQFSPPANDINDSFLTKAGRAMDRSAANMSNGVKSLFKESEAYKNAETPKKKREADASLYVAVAQMHEYGGKPLEAEKQYQLALQKDPKNLPALLGLAHVYEQVHKPAEAQQMYAKAIQYHPNDPAAHNDLGLYLAKQSQHKQAVDSFERAISKNPESKLYRNNIARSLVALNRRSDAFTQLSMVYDPEVAYYNLGFLLVEQGDQAAAMNHFRKALDINPSFAEAHQWYSTLAARFRPAGGPQHPALPSQPQLARQVRPAAEPAAPSVQPPPFQTPRPIPPAPAVAHPPAQPLSPATAPEQAPFQSSGAQPAGLPEELATTSDHSAAQSELPRVISTPVAQVTPGDSKTQAVAPSTITNEYPVIEDHGSPVATSKDSAPATSIVATTPAQPAATLVANPAATQSDPTPIQSTRPAGEPRPSARLVMPAASPRLTLTVGGIRPATPGERASLSQVGSASKPAADATTLAPPSSARRDALYRPHSRY